MGSVSKTTPKIDTETYQKFSHLLRRTKRGTRPVGFFRKGPPRAWLDPYVSQKYPGLSQKYPVFSQNVPFFPRKVHVAKERANTKVKGRMPQRKTQKYQVFFKIAGFSQNASFFWNVQFFSKCSLCPERVPKIKTLTFSKFLG